MTLLTAGLFAVTVLSGVALFFGAPLFLPRVLALGTLVSLFLRVHVFKRPGEIEEAPQCPTRP